MSDVSQWSTTAANNNAAPPDGWPESQAPSTVNNCARELMAALAKWYSDTDGSLASGGAANAYTLTTNSTHAVLADMPLVIFRANHACTGAATLAVDGLAAKSIKKNHDAALVSGDIEQNQIVVLVYNTTDDTYEMVSESAIAKLPDPLTTRGDIVIRDASATTRLAVGGANTVLKSDGTDPAWGAVTEAMQTLADNVTNDVSTTKHGYTPKAPNDTTKFLRGDATWATSGGSVDVQTFTSTNTWTKPASAPATAETLIEEWGAGASGASRTTTGNASGGGSGGYVSLIVPLSTLSGTETATIGTGGTGVSGNTNGNAGGVTSFTMGSKTLTINGGTGGMNDNTGAAVAGGDSGSISGTISANAVWPKGGTTASNSGLNGATGGYVTSGAVPAAGGNSVNGGGGGGGCSSTAGGTRTGGTSINGGNGGDGGANTGGAGGTGTAPSGGGGGAVQGGTSGAGANGQIRITVRW